MQEVVISQPSCTLLQPSRERETKAALFPCFPSLLEYLRLGGCNSVATQPSGSLNLAFSCSNKCSYLMWAPINTSAILQSAKAEIWKQCCTVLLETYSMAPCNIFIQTKSLAHKAVVRKVKVFNTRQRATNLYLKTNHILPVINEILGIFPF